ncbi:PPOX class F420-dependent oxidoreductase [Actinospongicola halichondriae]|uniref:PPOX class F420-dependent oxidoreductase n=1 Tax=Actinospongicola halichondriae TaxID=3236844 RepID=UPI003D5CDC0C
MSRRDQIKMTDAEMAEYLDGRHTMNIATLNHDGSIHLVAMWYAMDGTNPVFWTYNKAQKIKNIERDPRITCLVETGDQYEELRGVELVGTAELITERDEIMPLGEMVAARYTGPVTDETRPFIHAAGEKRFAVRVHVERTVSWDHRKLGGTY